MSPPLHPTFSRALAIILLWNLLTDLALAAIIPQHALTSPSSHRAKDKVGAVASESNICSHIGIDVLKLGGNAADAVSASIKLCDTD